MRVEGERRERVGGGAAFNLLLVGGDASLPGLGTLAAVSLSPSCCFPDFCFDESFSFNK